jgi:hypothetical protein
MPIWPEFVFDWDATKMKLGHSRINQPHGAIAHVKNTCRLINVRAGKARRN